MRKNTSMGVIIHDSILFEGDIEYLKPLRKKILKWIKKLDLYPQMISEISKPVMNGYTFMCLLPDGSKEHWEISDSGDVLRDKIKKYIRNNEDITYVHFYVGEGNIGCGIGDYDSV